MAQTNSQSRNIFKKLKHAVTKAASTVEKTATTVASTVTAAAKKVETEAEREVSAAALTAQSIGDLTAKIATLSAATVASNVAAAVAEAASDSAVLAATAKAAAASAYKAAVAAGEAVANFWGDIECTVCLGASEALIDLGSHFTCAAFDPLVDAACEAAGAGPEDPFADGCAAIFDGGCEIILAEIELGVSAADRICADLQAC
jgi:hypothetical protein